MRQRAVAKCKAKKSVACFREKKLGKRRRSDEEHGHGDMTFTKAIFFREATSILFLNGGIVGVPDIMRKNPRWECRPDQNT